MTERKTLNVSKLLKSSGYQKSDVVMSEDQDVMTSVVCRSYANPLIWMIENEDGTDWRLSGCLQIK